ncbi:MAG: cell division protein ZapA [Bacteroidales bacterium]|nr:cell division protein ZapA [Bacteroidales bacterium]
MEDDTFKIHLYIADEDFFVELKRNDQQQEALYRQAARQISRLMNAYREKYHGEGAAELDTKRLLAMTALHLAKKNLEVEANTDDSRCLTVVGQLDEELKRYLKN